MRVNNSIIIARPATTETFEDWRDCIEGEINRHNKREANGPTLNGDRRGALLSILQDAVNNGVAFRKLDVAPLRRKVTNE